MVPYIPSDIWTTILEQEWSDNLEYVPFTRERVAPPIVAQLSLVNRNLRRLALPFLFHTLEFSASYYLLTEEASIPRLIRQSTRVQSLLSGKSRHLLRHVQRFALYGWSSERTGTVDLGDLRELAEAIFGMISNLVVFTLMPRLRDIRVEYSPVTLRLHEAMFSPSRPLHSIEISSWSSNDVRHFPAEPAALSIRELNYSMADSPAMRAHFVCIIYSAMKTLRRLKIPTYVVSVLVTCIDANSDISLPLEDLSIMVCSHDQKAAIWNLFRVLPDLRSLHIDEAEELEPPGLSATILPNLEFIEVRANLAPSLTFRKKLQKVIIRNWLDGGLYSAPDIIQSSPLHLREVDLGIYFVSYQQFLSFLRSLRPFKNLECLRLDMMGRAPQARHEKQITREEICDAVVKELKQWKSLKKCSMQGCLWPKEDDPWFDIAHINNSPCPIAPECDPLSRGHDSLETLSLQFLGISQWDWIPGKGWTRGRGRMHRKVFRDAHE